MKTKIAILILAHDNENQLLKLVNRLKSDFDIFIHIDKKCKLMIPSDKNVYVFKKYKVYWGSFNQIQATLLLLKEAYKNLYERYILISGKDIPIVSNEKIIDFFTNNNCEYLEYEKLPRSCWVGNGGFERLEYYFENMRQNTSCVHDKFLSLFSSRMFRLIRNTSRKLGYKRPIKVPLYGGANWMNLTHHCLNYIFDYLTNNRDYIARYRYTRCADEIFFQSIICNSTFIKSTVNDSLRYIDWTSCSGSPKTLKIEDYDKIINSNKLFARKFDENIDNHIIKNIYRNKL